MSARLSVRLIAALVLLVLGTAAMSFFATGRVVLAPLSQAVFEAYVDQALYVADQVEGGADPRHVADRLGLRVRRVDELPPPPPPPRGRGRRPPRDSLRVLERDGREVRYHPGPKDHLHVKMDRGWLHVHRGADLPDPEGRLATWLLAVSLLAAVIGAWVVRSTLQPLQATTEAMRRVAEGDLEHRLPPGGPPEVQAASEAFHAMTQRVKLLLAADRELVAGVSHELRTPLTRLGLRLELLADEVGPHPKLDDMATDLDELNGLVAELLELSRLQLGQVLVEPVPSDLGALVQRALEASELDAERVQVGADGPTLSVDPTLTVRALGNLFQNVHRYAPEGPVEVRFTPHSLTVADRGPGVPEAQLTHLTEPFVRVDESRAKHTGGLGLGLMIVKQVQALHGGSVQLANREGGGLEVTLGWPDP